MLQADFRVVETYRPGGGDSSSPGSAPRLACPVVALGAGEDRRFSRQQLDAWRDVAPPGEAGGFILEAQFPGGHRCARVLPLWRPRTGRLSLLRCRPSRRAPAGVAGTHASSLSPPPPHTHTHTTTIVGPPLLLRCRYLTEAREPLLEFLSADLAALVSRLGGAGRGSGGGGSGSTGL